MVSNSNFSIFASISVSEYSISLEYSVSNSSSSLYESNSSLRCVTSSITFLLSDISFNISDDSDLFQKLGSEVFFSSSFNLTFLPSMSK